MSQAVVPPTPAATVAAGIALPLVGGSLVALRFYSKHVQRADIFLEDWLTIPAFFLTLGLGICMIYGVANKALAYPTPQPSNPKDLPTFVAREITINRQLEYAVLMMQIPAITCIKLAFLFFYKRIFCTSVRTRVKYAIWTLIILCTLWGVAFFFSFVFICGVHFSALWGSLLQFKRHCSHILDWNTWMSITDFALDVIIFIFPMPLLWRLQLSTARKLAVMAVFMVGGLTVAASITRLVIFIRAVQNLRKAYVSKGADNSVISAGLYWTTFEVGMALISVCLPSCYGLLKQALNGNFGSKTTSYNISDSHRSGRFQGGSARHDKHVKLDDLTPLSAPVVTTDIRVDIEEQSHKRNSRGYFGRV